MNRNHADQSGYGELFLEGSISRHSMRVLDIFKDSTSVGPPRCGSRAGPLLAGFKGGIVQKLHS